MLFVFSSIEVLLQITARSFW